VQKPESTYAFQVTCKTPSFEVGSAVRVRHIVDDNGGWRKRNVANTRPFLASEVGLDDETTKNDHCKAVLFVAHPDE